MNQYEVEQRESDQRTAVLNGSVEALNKTLRQQRGTIEVDFV